MTREGELASHAELSMSCAALRLGTAPRGRSDEKRAAEVGTDARQVWLLRACEEGLLRAMGGNGAPGACGAGCASSAAPQVCLGAAPRGAKREQFWGERDEARHMRLSGARRLLGLGGRQGI